MAEFERGDSVSPTVGAFRGERGVFQRIVDGMAEVRIPPAGSYATPPSDDPDYRLFRFLPGDLRKVNEP